MIGNNPKGLLAMKVRASFEGEGFRQFRAERAAQTQKEQAQWQAIPDDPESTEETRQLARQALGPGK